MPIKKEERALKLAIAIKTEVKVVELQEKAALALFDFYKI